MSEMHWPSWRYHQKHGSRIVHSHAEAQKLGPGWVQSPADLPEDEIPVVDTEPVSVDEPQPKRRTKKGTDA